MAFTDVQVLPTAVPGVRRALVRGADGTARERVEGVELRAQELPRGGVFADWRLDGAALDLGAPLARTLRVLEPPPLVLLHLVLRVLEDLESLHASGCVHGALHADGWGVDPDGTFRVRPVLHEPLPQASTPWAADLAAVAGVLRGRVDAAAMEAEGVARGALWLRGMGLGTGAMGYADPRAARQSLLALVRDVRVDAAAEAWMTREQVRMPPRGGVTGGRRVRAASVGADVERSARAWVEREVARSRAEGLVRMREDVERVLREERAAMEAALDASRARQAAAHHAREAAVDQERETRRREQDARRVAAASRLALAAAPEAPAPVSTGSAVSTGSPVAGASVRVGPPEGVASTSALRVDGIVLGGAPVPVAPPPAPVALSLAAPPPAPVPVAPPPSPVALSLAAPPPSPALVAPPPAPVALSLAAPPPRRLPSRRRRCRSRRRPPRRHLSRRPPRRLPSRRLPRRLRSRRPPRRSRCRSRRRPPRRFPSRRSPRRLLPESGPRRRPSRAAPRG